MSRKLKAELLVIFIFILSLVFLFVFVIGLNKKSPKAEEVYCMKAKENTVCLYKAEEIIKVYDGIVLSTLPIEDRERLESGINFKSIEEADRSAEDYDG